MQVLDTLIGFINDNWLYLAPVAPLIATAALAFRRRPKSPALLSSEYFADRQLLSPPIARPAYSDRMAYVLAEMSELAYFQFEERAGVIEDAILQAKSLDVKADTDVREFLEDFSASLMIGRKMSQTSLSRILERSGFALIDLIHVAETQGFVCKRDVDGEPIDSDRRGRTNCYVAKDLATNHVELEAELLVTLGA